MDTIVSAAKDEERRLLAQLANHPAFIRLQAVRNLIDAYSGPTTVAERVETIRSENIRVVGATQAQAVISRNVAAQVRAWVLPYLERHGGRVQSNILLEAAQREGIAIGGKNPIATMSSYLSGMPELDNVRGQGYGLKASTEANNQLRDLGLAELAGIDPAREEVEQSDLAEHAADENTETAEKDSEQEPSATSVGTGSVLD